MGVGVGWGGEFRRGRITRTKENSAVKLSLRGALGKDSTISRLEFVNPDHMTVTLSITSKLFLLRAKFEE